MDSMATSFHRTDPAWEKCSMCLSVWTSKGQIRKLPCLHSCCMECLQENQALNHRTVCPICRVDHGNLDFNLLDVAYEGSKTSTEDLTCGVRKCTTTSAYFCRQCKQHFCKRHQEAHDDLHDHEMMALTDWRRYQEETTPQLCEVHPDQAVVEACENCLVLKCERCQAKEDCPGGDGHHSLRSIGRVAESLSHVIREKLEKFVEKRKFVEKKLKQTLLKEDDINENTRLMLEQVNKTVEQMKEQIDREATQLIQQVLDYNSVVSGQAEKLTGSINAFLDEESDWTQSANQALRKSSSAQVGLHTELDSRGERLLAVEFSDFQPKLKRLADIELKVEFPLKLVFTQPPIPTNLKLKEEITTPDCCYTVTHHQGQIIHGGYKYPLTGLDFNPQLGGGGSVRSVCKHNNSLYVLQWQNDYNSVHIINLSTQAVRKAVIRYQSSGHNNHLTVNNNQIIITDYNSKSIKVYSTSDFSHQFDLESEHLSGWPYGIAQLPDGSLVVSDRENELVCNLTLEINPTTKWVRKDLVKPTGITMDSDSQFLLMTSYAGRKIYILSFSGGGYWKIIYS